MRIVEFPFVNHGVLRVILAKIHCVSDIDSIKKVMRGREHSDLLPLNIIPDHTEQTIRSAIGGDEAGFIEDMVSFAMVRARVPSRADSYLYVLRHMEMSFAVIINYSSKLSVTNAFRFWMSINQHRISFSLLLQRRA